LNIYSQPENRAKIHLSNEINLLVPENVYGSSKRLAWLVSHLTQRDSILELGCGTGYMICLPLVKLGYSIQGLDQHAQSIEYGRRVFQEEGVDPSRLKTMDLADMKESLDVIIASEVLEHLSDRNLGAVLRNMKKIIKPTGRLLVTVPNGYGWFEMESFMWNKLGLGKLLKITRIANIIESIKPLIFGKDALHLPHPSTLSESPHVQRFTLQKIKSLLQDNGFEIVQTSGSVLFAGPFTNLVFHGIGPFLKLNCFLGDQFPRLASAYFIACQVSQGD